MGEICSLEVIVCNLNMKENAPLCECSKGSFLVPSFWLPVKVTLSKYNGIMLQYSETTSISEKSKTNRKL
jgi:hypothetical protein